MSIGDDGSEILTFNRAESTEWIPVSVSGIQQSCMTADVPATAMVVLGPERGLVVARQCRVDMMFLDIDANGKLTDTSIGVFRNSEQ